MLLLFGVLCDALNQSWIFQSGLVTLLMRAYHNRDIISTCLELERVQVLYLYIYSLSVFSQGTRKDIY